MPWKYANTIGENVTFLHAYVKENGIDLGNTDDQLIYLCGANGNFQPVMIRLGHYFTLLRYILFQQDLAFSLK